MARQRSHDPKAHGVLIPKYDHQKLAASITVSFMSAIPKTNIIGFRPLTPVMKRIP